MFVVTVEFEIFAENIDQFRDEMLRQAENSLKKEQACRQFDVCFDPDSTTTCFLYEKYDDKAAFEFHLASDHFKQFDATVSHWVKTKIVRVWNQTELDQP